MSFHSDLASLCALDTFIGNYDRSWENLSYNSTTNRFCGIDQGSSFTKKLAPLTYRRVKELEKKDIFRIVLNKLSQAYAPIETHCKN